MHFSISAILSGRKILSKIHPSEKTRTCKKPMVSGKAHQSKIFDWFSLFSFDKLLSYN